MIVGMKPMNSILEKDMKEIFEASSDLNFHELQGKTFFITGANGMIASYLVYFLLHLNDIMHLNIQVVGLVRNQKKAEKGFSEISSRKDFSLCVQDICHPIAYDGAVDFVVHAASPTAPSMFREHPVEVIKANTLGTLHVLEFAQKNGAEVMLLSTREIYGKCPERCEFVTEDEFGSLVPTDVRSCYPESKRLAENLCVSYAHEYGVSIKIARIAHTYGPGMPLGDGRVLSDFLLNVINSEPIVLNSDGSTVLALTYLSDTIAGLVRLLLRRGAQVRNISSDRCVISVRELAEKLCQMFPERKMSVCYQKILSSQKEGYLQYKVPFLSSQKIYEEGWNPSVTVEEGIKRTVLYYEMQLEQEI